MKNDEKELTRSFSMVFGNKGDEGRSPGPLFLEEIFFALEDFRFSSCFGGRKTKPDIERERQAYEVQKHVALNMFRKSPRLRGASAGLKEYLAYRYFLSAMIKDKDWAEVWEKFRGNCRTNPRLSVYIDHLMI